MKFFRMKYRKVDMPSDVEILEMQVSNLQRRVSKNEENMLLVTVNIGIIAYILWKAKI